jgi:hypothetical protein
VLNVPAKYCQHPENPLGFVANPFDFVASGCFAKTHPVIASLDHTLYRKRQRGIGFYFLNDFSLFPQPLFVRSRESVEQRCAFGVSLSQELTTFLGGKPK